MEKTTKKLMIRNARLSYVTVDEPRSIVEGGEPYYSISVIIEPDNPATAEIKKTVDALINEQKWTPAQKKVCDKALRDGNEERAEDEAYANNYFINAKSRQKPLLIDGARREVPASKFYSGCYANVSVSLYAYDKAGNRGVGCGLRGVQFVKDGEPLGSTVSADEFDKLEDDEVAEDFV